MTGNHRHINQPHTLRRRDYLGPYLFTDNEFDRYETAEGYVTPDDIYHAYVPDYQGTLTPPTPPPTAANTAPRS